MKPDDKPMPNDSNFEKPKLIKVVDGKKFPVPALETAFVDYSQISDESKEVLSGCLCNPVGTSVCSCNKVKVVCSCVGYHSCPYVSQKSASPSDSQKSTCPCVSHTSTCSCVSYTSERRVTGCRCAPVH
jgi:hypothetical protein